MVEQALSVRKQATAKFVYKWNFSFLFIAGQWLLFVPISPPGAGSILVMREDFAFAVREAQDYPFAKGFAS